MTLEAGDTIGRYVVQNKIAEGGMAEVYLCKSQGVEGFTKQVAVKRIRTFLAKDREFVRMFIDEARNSSLLNHPNVVQVFDFDKHQDTYYLAMEYVPGFSLWDLRVRTQELMIPIPPVLVCHIGEEVARGLDYAHRLSSDGHPMGLVHRDVTPHNILLSRDGAVKLTDFGIARVRSRATTSAGMIKGKFAYMAPEQARGEEVDPRTDVFALGIILWELFTGAPLFEGTSDVALLNAVREAPIRPPTLLNRGLPQDMEDVVLKALQRDPNLRFQSAHEFERALAECIMRNRVSVEETDVGYFLTLLFGPPAMQPNGSGGGHQRPHVPTVLFDGDEPAPKPKPKPEPRPKPKPIPIPPPEEFPKPRPKPKPKPKPKPITDQPPRPTPVPSNGGYKGLVIGLIAGVVLSLAGVAGGVYFFGDRIQDKERDRPDAGQPVDAGTPPDAGEPDAGESPDAGPPTPDAGFDNLDPPPPPPPPRLRPGTLVVKVRPWAQVSVDGKPPREVYGSRVYRLPPGPHLLKLQHPTGTKVVEIVVESSKTVTYEYAPVELH